MLITQEILERLQQAPEGSVLTVSDGATVDTEPENTAPNDDSGDANADNGDGTVTIDANSPGDSPSEDAPQDIKEENNAPLDAAISQTVDITTMTSNDLLQSTVDQRLAEFSHTIEELNTTVNLMAQEIANVKSHFSVIESGMDRSIVSEPKDIESLDRLINMI